MQSSFYQFVNYLKVLNLDFDVISWDYAGYWFATDQAYTFAWEPETGNLYFGSFGDSTNLPTQYPDIPSIKKAWGF